jgi:hypothetical protein
MQELFPERLPLIPSGVISVALAHSDSSLWAILAVMPFTTFSSNRLAATGWP